MPPVSPCPETILDMPMYVASMMVVHSEEEKGALTG